MPSKLESADFQLFLGTGCPFCCSFLRAEARGKQTPRSPLSGNRETPWICWSVIIGKIPCASRYVWEYSPEGPQQAW